MGDCTTMYTQHKDELVSGGTDVCVFLCVCILCAK